MLIFHDFPVQGALFDMDGTMFDTERLRFETLKQASEELIGQEFSDEYLMQCLGLSAKTAEQLAKKFYGKMFHIKQLENVLMSLSWNLCVTMVFQSKKV
jgi:beta-phosphoglucomutase-like phosphatase (HAD superfamily)